MQWRGAEHWKTGRWPLLLSRKYYALNADAMLLDLALNFVGINSVEMLFYSAVLNGVLAPFDCISSIADEQIQKAKEKR
jgi:hypothetical protein